jgi:predicted RecA/RadA family phage recombinase
MASNAVQQGDILTIDPGATVASGAGAILGTPAAPIFGISQDDAVSGAESAFYIGTGIYNLAKTTGTAWVKGQPVYFKYSTSAAITLSSGNYAIGVASEAATSGSATGKVKLYGVNGAPAGASVLLEGQGATAAGASATISVGADFNGKAVKVFVLTNDTSTVHLRSAVVAAGDLVVTYSASCTAKFLYQVMSTDVA